MSDPHPLVCRFGALGDMVLTTPLLKQLYLRSGLPCDVIGIGAWNRQLFQHLPWVRNVFTIGSRSTPYWIDRSQRELINELKRRRHRFAWVCETNEKSYRLLARAGINRANSATQLDLEPVRHEHYTETWVRLGTMSPPGFDHPPRQLEADTELCVGANEVDECRRWLETRGVDAAAPVVCIQAGSKRTMRRGRPDRASNTKYWPEWNWAAVIDEIVAQLPAAQVLLCGIPAELDLCRAIHARCRAPVRVHCVADDLPLRRLLALLSLAHSCISVDTGPAHAAAALGCPLVVLFGKADPRRFRPLSRRSPVQVLVGEAESGPDIGLITPQRVIDAWATIGRDNATTRPREIVT